MHISRGLNFSSRNEKNGHFLVGKKPRNRERYPSTITNWFHVKNVKEISINCKIIYWRFKIDIDWNSINKHWFLAFLREIEVKMPIFFSVKILIFSVFFLIFSRFPISREKFLGSWFPVSRFLDEKCASLEGGIDF